MASQRYNDDGLVQSHEMTLVRDQKGFWSGTQVYHCAKDRLATLVPATGTPHPDYEWMSAEGLRVSGEEGGWLKLEVDYTGLIVTETGDPEADNPPSYVLDLSLSEEPLETHPRYVTLTDDDVQEVVSQAKNPKTDEDGKPVPPSTGGWDPLKVELYDNIRRGFDAYRDPKVTWTKEWASTSQPDNLNNIGEIFTPDGDPPTPAAGRNWLFAGLQSRRRGQVYENSLIAELSGRGGWHTGVYGP